MTYCSKTSMWHTCNDPFLKDRLPNSYDMRNVVLTHSDEFLCIIKVRRNTDHVSMTSSDIMSISDRTVLHQKGAWWQHAQLRSPKKLALPLCFDASLLTKHVQEIQHSVWYLTYVSRLFLTMVASHDYFSKWQSKGGVVGLYFKQLSCVETII